MPIQLVQAIPTC